MSDIRDTVIPEWAKIPSRLLAEKALIESEYLINHSKDYGAERFKAWLFRQLGDYIRSCAPAVDVETMIGLLIPIHAKCQNPKEFHDWLCSNKAVEALSQCRSTSTVEGEVVEALQIINDAHTLTYSEMADKYKLGDINTTKWAWTKVDEALSHAGTCRCDCEKYRRLIPDIVDMLEELRKTYMEYQKESISKTNNQNADFWYQETIRVVEMKKKLAALGAEEEKK